MIKAYEFSSAAELTVAIEEEVTMLNTCDSIWINIEPNGITWVYVIVLSNSRECMRKVVYQTLNIITGEEGDWVIGTSKDVAELVMSLLKT